ncbi:DUF4037 domain-containing protein [Halobacillus salinarum]|uniref:DUF4037 domain-containing protein n=1 Tax=Halobacillus salinarum TaxID=2932257 RepID=A0ABY4EL26_9BACI|nr:DUF4037 domain-containing protein [Halobacillus salinarum]UOQ45171.1 DUF4037 domain-containing protein [Halobacillus salinarum]
MTWMRIAETVGGYYAACEKIKAVLLAGSVSRGWQDARSDIELHVFWEEAPTESERLQLIEKAEGTLLTFYPYEDDEWSESYLCDGVKMELSHFLGSTIDMVVNRVIRDYSTNLEDQCLISAIQDGIVLHGKTVISEWKNTVNTYPQGLKEAMVEENLDFGNRWKSRSTLLERRDLLILYSTMADVSEKIMALLFALNHEYVHHPGFKWQKQSLNKLSIKPMRACERMESVFLTEPEKGMKILEQLTADVEKLVNEQSPREVSHKEIKQQPHKNQF